MALIRKFLPYAVAFVGFALVAHGVWMVYEPAAWILSGLLLAAAGLVHDWERGA